MSTPALHVCLSRLPWFSPWTRDEFRQLRGMGDYSLNASKDSDIWELLTLRLLVDQNQWLMEYVLQDAGSRREDESSDVCCVGEKTLVFL